MSDEQHSGDAPHPDFDGHLEKDLLSMTMAERLHWAWQGMCMLRWAEEVRQQTAAMKAQDDGKQRRECQ